MGGETGHRPERPIGTAARRTLNRAQIAAALLVLTPLGALAAVSPAVAGLGLTAIGYLLFSWIALWRLLLIRLSSLEPASDEPWPCDDDAEAWPRYTVLAALYDEGAMVAQLAGRLAALDYPRERIEGWLVLEADDHETLEAAREASLSPDWPEWLGVHVVPFGSPRTKPRALNHALARATGDIVTIYDAEDDPDPLQLREAAWRLRRDEALACVQAPLRVRAPEGLRGKALIPRQFAAEYAGLFEVTLPALARIGMPFPLGGTSNHFRADRLRAVGGWDAWNVTEDADLGYRLWRQGWSLGVIRRPTYEAPPETLRQWLPQRTRWLKGYMQTLGVHSRAAAGLGPRGIVSILVMLATPIVSAALHGPSLSWLGAAFLMAAVSGTAPITPAAGLAVMIAGTASAWLNCAVGARRAGIDYDLADMLSAPFYWSLLSLAFLHAFWRLLTSPYAWDKTPHQPDQAPMDAVAEPAS